MLIDVTIEGQTPLLCNKFTDAAAMAATNGARATRQPAIKARPANKRKPACTSGKTASASFRSLTSFARSSTLAPSSRPENRKSQLRNPA